MTGSDASARNYFRTQRHTRLERRSPIGGFPPRAYSDSGGEKVLSQSTRLAEVSGNEAGMGVRGKGAAFEPSCPAQHCRGKRR